MIVNILLLSIAFIVLVVGTITDIKTREVPDWINFGIIFSGIGIRLIYSAVTFNWMFLAYGLFGLAAAVIIAYMMFYAGQWGGGDAKLLMGMGALIGLPFSFEPAPLILVFMINILLIGAFYGLGYSVVLAIVRRNKFRKYFSQLSNTGRMGIMRRFSIVLVLIFVPLFLLLLRKSPFSLMIIMLMLLMLAATYLIIFVKSVELSSMYRFVEPEKLTEGDWIARDYIIDGKKICGPKDLGISKKQIKMLIKLKKQKKIKKNIKIKEGIPFVPSFLIAFVLSLGFGAWWMLLL